MGKKGKKTSIPQVDPNKLIQQNEQMNRVNISTPFGSQQYVTGPDGRQTLQTSLSPEMQNLFTQQFQRAGAPAAQYHLPEGQSQLLAALLAKRNAAYGAPPNG